MPANNSGIGSDARAVLHRCFRILPSSVHSTPGVGHVCKNTTRPQKNIILAYHPGVNRNIVLHFYIIAKHYLRTHYYILTQIAIFSNRAVAHYMAEMPYFGPLANVAALV